MTSQYCYDLDRFVRAQASNYGDALAELKSGKKQTHWSWYVFPQICGLGSSAMSVRYAIASLPEAVAYLEHPTLGPRLRECIALLMSHHTRSAEEMLGEIDAQKLRSCLTLFAHAAPSDPLFRKALDKFFDGTADAATIDILAAQQLRERA